MAGPRTLTFLGTGTSVGVPMIGCDCAVCTSTDPRNHRFRTSVLVGTPEGNLLIDTSPELRLQLLRERVRVVHAVLYTHYHVDHLFGMDDLRVIPKYLGRPVPVYCAEEVEGVMRRAFPYVFHDHPPDMPLGAVPKLDVRRLTGAPFDVLGQRVTPIPLEHGSFKVYGFRFGDELAYCTDVSEIPPASWPLLQGVRVLVIDALRLKPHPAHLSLGQALEVIERVRPEQAYLTHMSHELEYEAVSARLPPGVRMAYDGLKVEF